MYSHQAKAINDLWDKNHVIVSTSTASGKSLIYQVPVIDALERDPDVRALYIFPTKALAQDQKKSLVNILSNMPELSRIFVETFDGDTPHADRTRIRENASGKPGRCRLLFIVVFTNPDTLHITILPNEDKWRSFLKNLKYVVVDGNVPKVQPDLTFENCTFTLGYLDHMSDSSCDAFEDYVQLLEIVDIFNLFLARQLSQMRQR